MFFKRIAYALKRSMQDEALFPSQLFPDLDVEKCAEEYILNMHLARAYCEHIGAVYFNYLQPYNGAQTHLSKFDLSAMAHIRRRVTKHGENEQEIVARFYQILKDKLKHTREFSTLEPVVRDCEEDLYLDHGHFSDKGYDLLACAIVKDIQGSSDK